MFTPSIDIVIPVWNRPVETRDCVVSLMATAPTARLILFDNGSDRETERLLEEFAEGLGEQALLLKNRSNQGYVKAVNRGLDRSEAPFVILVRNTSIVSEGWLEPMLELATARSDAGLIVPKLVTGAEPRRAREGSGLPRVIEVSHGSFAALLMRRELLECQGGFDEDLDGGAWCLKDYSRRALKNGFLTFAAEGGAVRYKDDILFGSTVRREETVRRSAAAYDSRWGTEDAFCVYWPREADPEVVHEAFGTILKGARMGHRFTVIVHSKLHKALADRGYDSLHRSIRVEVLPYLFSASEVRKIFGRLQAERSDTVPVAGVDGVPLPGVENSRSIAWLEEALRCREERCYHRGETVEIG
ncbi:MAG: glycosyltransferase [Desulfuromonadales bacterium]|nr:MAG: glycosyltransferase [Desulfuromonadales bacterium]